MTGSISTFIIWVLTAAAVPGCSAGRIRGRLENRNKENAIELRKARLVTQYQ